MAAIERHGVGPRLSAGVKHGDTIYIAGQVADDATAGVKGQTEQILKKIDGVLKHFHSHKGKLLSATVYLADMKGYDEMNAAWDAWIEKGNTPARATVESKLAAPKYLVEIAGIASA
jgi:enamine deaminase RidA (YjgF/YER057c/UK114 family)